MIPKKRTIKVKFVDFWGTFVAEDSLLFSILSKDYNLEISDSPEYLFFSVHGTKHLNYDCIKIFYTCEDQVPDFNVADYAIGFANLSFGDRYIRFPNYYFYEDDFKRMVNKTDFTEGNLHNKKGFCCFVYSNNNATPERSQLFEAINSIKKVASGGRYLNNIGGKPVKNKLEFQSDYKFSIACENYRSDGYVTEKLIQSFAARTIPIYLGDPSINNTFNSKAFINVSDYNSTEELLAEIQKIDQNDALYLDMMRAPALLHPEVDGYNASLRKLSNFLNHIIDQPYSSAYRINRGFWGGVYIMNLKKKEKAMSMSLFYRLDALYLKLIWRNRDKAVIKIVYKVIHKLTHS